LEGIGFCLNHFPLAKRKKSSPALAAESICDASASFTNSFFDVLQDETAMIVKNIKSRSGKCVFIIQDFGGFNQMQELI
jgi:hypothetical protein